MYPTDRWAVTRRWATLLSLMSVGVSVVAGTTAAQPVRARTLTFDAARGEWVDAPPPIPGTPEADLHDIRLLIGHGRYGKAVSLAKTFVERQGTSHELYPEALLAQAEAEIGRKRYEEAHAVLQSFLNEFSGMRLTDEALRLEFLVAEAYLRGAKRKFLGLPILAARDIGFKILDDISIDHPDSAHAELAIKTKADQHFADGEYLLAEIEYSRLLNEHPQSRYREAALARAAESALASFAGIEYDEAALVEAQDRFEQIRSRHPMLAQQERVDAVLEAIREMRAEKELRIGQYYERTQHLGSAVFYYQLVVTEWPGTIAAVRAAERLELLGVGAPSGAMPDRGNGG